MRNEVRMEIVPGATHLFEEPGTLDDVARFSRDWFLERLEATRMQEAGSRNPTPLAEE